MVQEEKVTMTPQGVLKRLKQDMPQDAPIVMDRVVIGYEQTGIEAALNQLYSYDKDAVLAWLNKEFPAGVN